MKINKNKEYNHKKAKDLQQEINNQISIINDTDNSYN